MKWLYTTSDHNTRTIPTGGFTFQNHPQGNMNRIFHGKSGSCYAEDDSQIESKHCPSSWFIMKYSGAVRQCNFYTVASQSCGVAKKRVTPLNTSLTTFLLRIFLWQHQLIPLSRIHQETKTAQTCYLWGVLRLLLSRNFLTLQV